MSEESYPSVIGKINHLASQREKPVCLIAVSKTKPKEAIQHLYNVYNHRVFGENYIQELHEKATELEEVCPDIEWHFIGRLQSNKLKLLVSTPHLKCVQTVHSIEIAEKLNKACINANKTIDVMVQINSSGEEQKGGVSVEEAISVVKEVMKCSNLHFIGIMTIGMVGDSKKNFTTMKQLADTICSQEHLGSIEISMGMSSDYEQAIELGATMVRVGTALFGARDYSKHQ
ncbi:pyridoxal phosphate enzyme family protein [Entamoeba histolytica HM-1:IMSS-B]|uniref:Pyridoxal phosphate homeostasis protein n=6 Tax=Entamoeba histolytica TaxID=5759 RepID=C4M2U6_ENTH1|nr:hypothetical protein, conserved [Entamoeba histolytica HM-1:IMSS]EMD46274.1 proline synthetase -associated protein, putative [Entamoeba histolytica KU27]EMH74136.1 pyridoxal phosphate enzyme family protein [Entamoeba histolytica HM-1:IMSS-B]EMS15903.1 proline synthetase associated protein [Entamoeba histolytica HM-3:IMSS]ENY60215.1 proline synthetase associated protein, putative [Entamoeba histolytica HM-1:IMSS-A]GAT95617.1 hypothetical protein conserved [Entamoeba histolytica]|eukprot:XP_655138.1 hypothetical protein, conserved [Entamoeba histolytica HM-1:IMSS]